MKFDGLKYQWYALHTRSRFENVVYDGLTKKSVEAFLPKIRVPSKRRDRRMTILRPLFPGYLFVKTDLSPHEHIEIVKTIGAVNLIGPETGPVSVRDDSIESLKIMTAESDTIQTGVQYRKGAPVMVINGAFTGVIGIFDRYRGHDRVVVHIEALGQFAAVHVDENEIEPIELNHFVNVRRHTA